MRKVAGVLAVVVALGLVGFACLRVSQGTSPAASPASRPATPATAVAGAGAKPAQPAPAAQAHVAASIKGARTATDSLTAGGRKRGYEVITPAKPLPKQAPVIVMLSGIGAATASGASVIASEIGRDDLVGYAASDQAEVVYPEPLYGSWNAVGCCGAAAAKNVNDLAFLKALVPKVDPGHARPVDLVGYSNGARLAYRVACDDPALFDGYAMVKGEPVAGCRVRQAATIIQIASVNDPEVPYQPGDHGSVESLAVTTLVSQLRAAEHCEASAAVGHSGEMTLRTWSGCDGGSRIALAAWAGGVHSFPRPPGSVPAASQVIWSFFTKTRLAPLPS